MATNKHILSLSLSLSLSLRLLIIASSVAGAQEVGEFPVPARFIAALAASPEGSVWVGTEDDGVFQVDPVTDDARQFTTKDGLGDDHAYALAVDLLGRVWVGHQSHGVSVFDGRRWQNYEVVAGMSRPDTLAGPLGERAFDIAPDPTTGDVWIATNLGLSRYSVSSGQWSHRVCPISACGVSC